MALTLQLLAELALRSGDPAAAAQRRESSVILARLQVKSIPDMLARAGQHNDPSTIPPADHRAITGHLNRGSPAGSRNTSSTSPAWVLVTEATHGATLATALQSGSSPSVTVAPVRSLNGVGDE